MSDFPTWKEILGAVVGVLLAGGLLLIGFGAIAGLAFRLFRFVAGL